MHSPHTPNNTSPTRLAWRRDGTGWLLVAGRRRFGRVRPVADQPGMWSPVPGSDIASLSWAKNAVLVEAERELAFEGRQHRAIRPPETAVSGRVFSDTSSGMRPIWSGHLRQPKRNGGAV